MIKLNDTTILDVIDLHTDQESKGRGVIAISLPYEAKLEFDELQKKTDKKFSKALKDIVLRAIELGKDKVK